ncbi:CMP-N-acetylneuraminate-beta-1,4-galactoside alpha-2,3-sialyltransferase-like isoform X2 [Ptychodera flava]|uniref:CMP-N-acetylneuraminate-beta-1,4-galactoside alpha-2,3-sialyltransferase-like isoform X2 n=1 Tax=Ptychodera flava TaxID=63121 RepID=UPI00396A85BD
MVFRHFRKLLLATTLSSIFVIILSYFIFIDKTPLIVPRVATITGHFNIFTARHNHNASTSLTDDNKVIDTVNVPLITPGQNGREISPSDVNIVKEEVHEPIAVPGNTQISLNQSQHVVIPTVKQSFAPKTVLQVKQDVPHQILPTERRDNAVPKTMLQAKPTERRDNPALKTTLQAEPPSACTPHLAVNMMKRMTSKFDETIPVFLSTGFENWNQKLMQYAPPFGLRNQVPLVTRMLSLLTDSRTPREMLNNNNGCVRCVIVGSGGIMKGTGLGSVIDGYDLVFRLNAAPIAGYESDVGSKTSMRVAYPEGTPSSYGDPGSLYALVSFKDKDFLWLEKVVQGQKPSTSGFWKSVPTAMSKKPSEARLVNPLVVREASFDLIGFPVNNGIMSRNTPTTGTMLISMAIRMCDEVHVAGFGYDFSKPELPIHYYENTKMKVIASHHTHNVPLEKQFLKKLVDNGVIKDLTGGIHWG